jgi:hypothetical protein
MNNEGAIKILTLVQKELDQISEEFATSLNMAKKSVEGPDPEFMTAMDSILSKLTCLEEPGEAESKVLGVVQAWMPIYMMLYEQVSGLIFCAWDGFSGGAMNAISVIVGCTITSFFLGDSNTTPMLGVMNIGIVIHELYSNRTRKFFQLLTMYFFRDAPIGIFPLQSLEYVLRGLVWHVAFFASSTYINAVWIFSKRPRFWAEFLMAWFWACLRPLSF